MDRINNRGRSNSSGGGRGSPIRSRGKSVKRLKNKFMHKIGAKIRTSQSSQESCDDSADNASSSRFGDSNHDGVDVDVERKSSKSENNDEAMNIPTTPPRDNGTGAATLTAPMLAKLTSTNSSLSLSPLRLSIFQNSLHHNPSGDSGNAYDVIKQSFESNNNDDDMDEIVIEQIDSNEDNATVNHHDGGSDLQNEDASEENKTAELNNRTRCRSGHDTSRSPSSTKHVKLLHRQTSLSSSQRQRHRRNIKKQKRRNQMDNKTSLSHEYNVDHSCSTPLERLARDVGNTLRQWDVHQGCDRHVSLDWMSKLASTTSAFDDGNALGQKEDDAQSLMSDVTEPDESSSTANAGVDDDEDAAANQKEEETPLFNPVMSMDMCERGFANRSRRINVWMGDEDNIDDELPNKITTAAPPPKLPQTSLEDAVKQQPHNSSSELDKDKNSSRDSNYYNGAQCIRSKKIDFQTVGFSPEITEDDPMTWKRRRYTIPLVLSLWDAPHTPSIIEQSNEDIADVDVEEEEEDEEANSIPLSLRTDPSPSSFSLLGELGILSSCGTQRSFYNDTNLITSKSVAFDKSRSPLRTGFGQDLSSLFNIGQHITLCLDTENSEDIQSLYSDMYAYIEDQIRLANESHRTALKERASRWKKQPRNKMQKEIDLEKEEVIDFESDIQMQKMSPSPFDADNSDTTNRILDAESDSFDEEMKLDGNGSIEDDDSVYVDDHISLNQQEMNNEVISALRSILHTAVSLAAAENDCNIPVFGIWGLYNGGAIDSGSNKKRGSMMFEGGRCAAPTWIVPPTPQDRDMNYNEESKLFLSSPIIVGTCDTPKFRSTHRVYSISEQNNLPTHLSTLDGLTKVMLAQCPSQRNEKVALIAARHCYCWNRNEVYTHNETYQEWRKAGQSNTGTATDLEEYRQQCQNQALECLERASANSRGFFWRQSSPLWGPSEGNPLFSLSASVSWGSIRTETPRQNPVFDSTAPVPTPLLQLPLKRRSAITPSPAELFEMDNALQSAALNPIGVGMNDQNAGDPREPIFFASATFDNNAPCATLSANTRCVLAALIRCGTLGLDTLPGHLTKTDVLQSFSPRKKKKKKKNSNNIMTSAEAEEVEIPESETKLREAIKLANVGSVTERLVDALDWHDTKIVSSGSYFNIESASYPDPPDETSFLNKNANSNMPMYMNHRSEGKAAPPGRLLSILFAHMSKLRTPPSMMKLWLSFVEELRTRWDRNETLPNLGFIPGLDIEDNDRGHGHSHRHINQSDIQVLGHRADLAAFFNSSEPDPLRDHCLINQKLQVFNICMESKLYTEYLFEKKMKQEQRQGSGSDDSSDGEDFYDAPMEHLSFDEKESYHFEQMLRQRAALSTATKQSRVGARCPVPYAMPLIESGDQVYAPYLQRTTPVTDEEEVKNKQMLGLDREDDNLSVHDRITTAQRLQKPKLLSDMSSFKAANKGAVFEDFVRWYGNPENPLGEELNEDGLKRKDEIRSKLSPEELKTLALKEASAAISILMNLRAFWEDTWDEAEAEAAFEQDPLFNPYITVEMMLHSLETIHPALLMNQIFAVNLSNARFVLKSASNQARQVRILAEGFRKLDNTIELALQALTKDCSVEIATNTKTDLLSHLATETIAKCEEACNQIGEFEILLSRSLALLEKLPGKYGLIDSLLQEGCTDGKFVFVKDPNDRDAFLGAIRSGQMVNVDIDPSSFFPDASMREYFLSNNDRHNPCQLNARLVPSTRGIASSFNGSLLLALSSSEHN